MDFLSSSLPDILTSSFMIFLGFLLLLNFTGLPINWIILGFLALWEWLVPFSPQPGLLFWLLLIGLCIGGELLENILQLIQSRQAGASKRGVWAGFIGAFIGSIFLAPLFFGLGALFGALFGAWLGCLLVEVLHGLPFSRANHAAIGTLKGKLLGTISKIGIGAGIIFISYSNFSPLKSQLIQ